MTQKKKKRRRLKKSVRLGCTGFVIGFVAVVSLLVGFCTGGNTPQEASLPDTTYVFHDTVFTNPAMARRIQKLVDTPLRIDTSRLGICVYDLTGQAMVYGHHEGASMVPASCMKLLTAIASLRILGCGHYYESSLITDGTVDRGTLTGTLVVAMDDDPLIESFSPLTDALKEKGIHTIVGDIVFDLARADTLRQHASAMPWDIPYSKVPLLMKGATRVRREFMQALSASGISFQKNMLLSHPCLLGIDQDTHPASYRIVLNRIHANPHTTRLARVRHSLREVVAPMLIHSSNIKAEAVFHHTAHALSRWAGPEADPATVMLSFIHHQLDIDTCGLVVMDGSGLSPQNRLTPRFLTQLLTWAWTDASIRRVLLGEALASPASPRSGSLMGRMRSPRFRDKVFCKTGTLTTKGVSSLSGYCLGADGHWYAFSIIHEDTPVYESRNFQDRLCGILVGGKASR